MKELFANITVIIYMSDGTIKKAYLTEYKENEIISLYNFNFSFKIVKINHEYIVIDLNENSDRFKIIENKILLKHEVKVIDISDNKVNIYIRLDSISEK